ncbi:MAG: hypothetical protein JWQ09_5513 [Segetibacter sp.]|nr:hypothetical protein [Segetibacter sp.]
MDNNKTIENRLLDLLKETSTQLTSEDIMLISEFIEHNEWGLAYETLCTQLDEYNAQISSATYEKITDLAKVMNIDSIIWQSLKNLVIN